MLLQNAGKIASHPPVTQIQDKSSNQWNLFGELCCGSWFVRNSLNDTPHDLKLCFPQFVIFFCAFLQNATFFVVNRVHEWPSLEISTAPPIVQQSSVLYCMESVWFLQSQTKFGELDSGTKLRRSSVFNEPPTKNCRLVIDTLQVYIFVWCVLCTECNMNGGVARHRAGQVRFGTASIVSGASGALSRLLDLQWTSSWRIRMFTSLLSVANRQVYKWIDETLAQHWAKASTRRRAEQWVSCHRVACWDAPQSPSQWALDLCQSSKSQVWRHGMISEWQWRPKCDKSGIWHLLAMKSFFGSVMRDSQTQSSYKRWLKYLVSWKIRDTSAL